jgi:site-specific recombinase XerD
MNDLTDVIPAPLLQALPAEIIDRVRKIIAAAIKGGRARKTVAAMKSDGRLFALWCGEHQANWLPASPETVADFVEAMAASGRRPATIQRYLASITMWHSAAELPTPRRHDLVKMARRAHAGSVGSRQKQAKGMGEAKVTKISQQLTEDAHDEEALYRLQALRDRALILVAHDTLARASELVNFRRQDLEIDDAGDGIILKRFAKTDQEGHGRKKWLDRGTVQALRAWFEAEQAELARRREIEDERFAVLRAKRFERKGAPQGRKRKHAPAEPGRQAVGSARRRRRPFPGDGCWRLEKPGHAGALRREHPRLARCCGTAEQSSSAGASRGGGGRCRARQRMNNCNRSQKLARDL